MAGIRASDGTFLTQDPIGLAGGVNLYAYAGNNPVAWSDPFGLCPPEDSCKRMRLAVEGRTYSTSPGLVDPTLLLGGLGSLGRSVGRLLGKEAAVVGERVLFEGSKGALRDALETGIPGVNAAQAGAIRESLKEGSADLVKVATGENGLTTYFTRAGRDGHQTLARMYDEAGELKRMAQAAWDAVGRFVHGEVWK